MAPSFETLVDNRAAKSANDLHGLVFSAFDKIGKTVISKSSGRLNWISDDLPGPDSTYWGFSFTKLFTTIAALQCVERGLVQLDQDLNSILPELKSLEVITLLSDKDKGKDYPSFSLTRAQTPITLHHLLTHTSGIGYDGLHAPLQAWRKSRGEESLFTSGKVIDAYSTPLLFQPGEGFAYGGSMDWAGVLISRLNKIPLSEYMEKNIFVPLGITSSTFNLESRPDLEKRLLQMSFRTADGLTAGNCALPKSPSEESGGVGLVSTVADHSAILLDLLSDSPKLLAKSTVDQMFQPKLPAGSASLSDLSKFTWFYINMTGSLDRVSEQVNIGYGGLVLTDDAPNLRVGTLVWGAKPGMVWFCNRKENIAGVMANQMLPPGDAPSGSMIGEFLRAAWDAKASA